MTTSRVHTIRDFSNRFELLADHDDSQFARSNVHTLDEIRARRSTPYDAQRANPPRVRTPVQPAQVTHVTLTRAEYDALLAAASSHQAAAIERTWGQSFRNAGTAVATVAVSAAVAAIVGHLAGRAINAAISSVASAPTPNVPAPQAPAARGVTEASSSLTPPTIFGGLQVDVGEPRVLPPGVTIGNRAELVQPIAHTGVRRSANALINGEGLRQWAEQQQRASVPQGLVNAEGIGPGPLPPPTPPWVTVPPPPAPPQGPGSIIMEAATTGAFTTAGVVIGGVVGGFTIPVVGAVPGELVGGFVGSLVGAAWNAIF